MIRIEIPGPIPSKKNQWGKRRGGVGLSVETRSEVDAITWRLIAAWRPRPPIRNETIVWRFWSPRKDRDNLYTTMLDCMKAAGMIEDDRAEAMNGVHVLTELSRDPVERVALEVIQPCSPGEHPLPRADEINALPDHIREYVYALETRADPAGEIRELIERRLQVEALQRRVEELESETLKEFAPDHQSNATGDPQP